MQRSWPLSGTGETVPSELDEPTLVDACLDNRPGAFDLVVERHRRPIYQFTPDDLADLAEGMRAESSAPNPPSCESCRQQLAEIRAVLANATDVDVPEPSPLFWEQLSQRVRRAVEAEAGRTSGRQRWQVAAFVAASAVAAVAIALLLNANMPTRPLPAANVETSRSEPLGAADDPSLVLVADLAATLDWADIVALPLATHDGGTDEAVAELSRDELQQLRTLLEEELQ